MKKTALSLFLFLIVVMLSAMTFTGNTMLSVHEAEGASDETLSELRRKAEQGAVSPEKWTVKIHEYLPVS